VDGEDYWSENGGTQVRQSLWLGYADGDHESNPSYRAHWHVREDGWMGDSLCRHEPVVIQREKPFCVRYLLHIHSETVNLDVAGRLADLFNASPSFTVSQAKRKHRQFEEARKEL
tara:strand:- start:382 stop:726 length:345 start_codon:yes stop_codon:yes gene_type:complete